MSRSTTKSLYSALSFRIICARKTIWWNTSSTCGKQETHSFSCSWEYDPL